jgi:hypothetical protein
VARVLNALPEWEDVVRAATALDRPVKQVLAQALVAPGTGRTGGPDPEREARTAEYEAAAPDDLSMSSSVTRVFPLPASPTTSPTVGIPHWQLPQLPHCL